MKRTTSVVASAAALALAAPVAGASADVAGSRDRQLVANKLVSPLSLAVNSNGAAYVSQNFAGQLVKVKKGRAPKLLARAAEGREIGAVEVRGAVVTFAVSWGNNEGGVVRQFRHGRTTTIGNIGAAEQVHNPDGANSYGFQDIDEECADQVPEEFGPATYDGIVETHPYATAVARRTTYVADAGANAIFKIADGQVTPVGALPPVGVVVSAETAEAMGMPECVGGKTYHFEPVPTDVEVGPDGALYVTSLPGGPEDGSMGANGSVLRMDPTTGAVEKVAGGFVSTTGIAVAPNGDLYVSELFTNRILRVPAGTSTPRPFRRATMPAALEIKGAHLYATTNVLSGMMEDGTKPNGKVMRFRL